MSKRRDELAPLRRAAKGLRYPSETDAPFEVVSGVPLPAGAEVLTLDAFFGELADGAHAARFARLRKAIDATLAEARVYRVGAADVAVWVLGTTPSGATAGLRTKSVET